jgi:hypothetical protein
LSIRHGRGNLGSNSAVVPAFQRAAQTVATLHQLEPCRHAPDEILVHVDGNQAACAEAVEGNEPEVIHGSTEILSRTNCVYFEVSQRLYGNFGYRVQDALRLMEQAGFQLFRPGSSGTIQKIDSQFDSDEVENLVAARDQSELLTRTGWTLR